MKKEWLESILEYSKKELEIINFDKVDVGQTILTLIEQSAELSNYDPKMTKNIIELVLLLTEKHPISPITESDFEEQVFHENNKTKKQWKCTRYNSVYIDDNGKCYDNNAVVFIDKKNPGTRYYTPASKKEVQLPYFPHQEVVYI